MNVIALTVPHQSICTYALFENRWPTNGMGDEIGATANPRINDDQLINEAVLLVNEYF